MRATFVESRGFTEAVPAILTDTDYAAVQLLLMRNPAAGTAMPGCGGLRKLRVADKARGQGKQGGARVIYLHVPAARQFFLLDIYGKDEKDDLAPGEKQELRQLAAQLKQDAVAAYNRWLEENLHD